MIPGGNRIADGATMMDLDDLKLFQLVASAKSIRAAADRLDVSRALIRRRIASLEQAFGYKLYTSSDKSFSLTPEGRRLLEEAPGLLSHVERLKDNMGRREKKILKIAMPIGVSTGFFMEFSALLWNLDQEINFDVMESEDPILHLDRGVDIVLCEGALPSYLDQEIRQLIWTGNAYLMGRRDYIERFDPSKGINFVHDMNVIFNNSKSAKNAIPLWNGGSIPFQPKLAISNESVISEWVQSGMGVGFFPEFNLRIHPDWAAIRPEEIGYEMTLSAISKPEALKSEEVRLFRSALKSFSRDKFGAASLPPMEHS